MAQNKIFVDGIFSDKKTGQYGDFYTVGIGPKFIEFYNEHKNDKGYINCLFTENAQGKPYMFLATPKDGTNNNQGTNRAVAAQTNVDIVNNAASDDDLPF